MKITDVQVKLVGRDRTRRGNDRIQGFGTVTFDGVFVVRDVRIVEGMNGRFVAMPNRKLTDRCGECDAKNHLMSRYCHHCGVRLDERRAKPDGERIKIHADVAHPISDEFRREVQAAVLEEFEAELGRSRASQALYQV